MLPAICASLSSYLRSRCTSHNISVPDIARVLNPLLSKRGKYSLYTRPLNRMQFNEEEP